MVSQKQDATGSAWGLSMGRHTPNTIIQDERTRDNAILQGNVVE